MKPDTMRGRSVKWWRQYYQLLSVSERLELIRRIPRHRRRLQLVFR